MLPVANSRIKNKIGIPDTFEPVNNTELFDLLPRVTPFGATSMRDAVWIAVDKILKLVNSGYTNYTFKVIVVTDGEDNSSVLRSPDISRYLKDMSTRYPSSVCNILFITIDLDTHEQANLDLIGITHNSSTHCKLIAKSSLELSEVFEREVFEYGVVEENKQTIMEDGAEIIVTTKRERNVQILREINFAVLFVLDISESMSKNNKWKLLYEAVLNIKGKLGRNEKNLVDCILFNNSVFTYKHLHFSRKYQNDWSSALFNDAKLLAFNILCPCFAPCCLSELARRTSSGTYFNGKRCCISIICFPILLTFNRYLIRKAYNIDGSCFTDCISTLSCCCMCMASQDWKESNLRGQSLIV